MPHLITWAVAHAELLILVAAPVLGWAAVLSEPRTVADVVRRER